MLITKRFGLKILTLAVVIIITIFPSSESERLLEALVLTRIKVMMSPSGVTICLTGTQASVDTHAGDGPRTWAQGGTGAEVSNQR